jgi:HK97 family phage portal protein
MTLIGRALNKVEARGSFGWPTGTIPPPGADPSIGNSVSSVSEAATLQLVDAYACTSLIADSVAMLPVDEFARGAEFRQPLPLSTIIDQPDHELDRWEWDQRMAISMALRGNAYSVHYEWDPRTGQPLHTRVVHPDDIFPRRNGAGGIEYVLRQSAKGGYDTVPASDVLHVRLVTLPGALKGLSPIECARRGIRMAINTENFGDRWFVDGAAPSSVLETDQTMDDDEAIRMQARWIAAHGGGRRRPAVLSGGMKWKPVTITPEESQFLESRKLNTSQIARIWRVPPHMIGDVEKSTSWGTGIEEQGIGYAVYTLGAYLFRLEAAKSRALLPKDRYTKYNVGGLLRGNAKDRYLSYAIARQWGWLSVNDIRRLEDLGPIIGGDVYLQPLNMIEAQAALDALTKPDPQGGKPA